MVSTNPQHVPHNTLPVEPAPKRRYGMDIPHGWMLAPFDLTEEMVSAFVDARGANDGEFPREAASWNAALAAAPALETLPPDTRVTLVPLEPPVVTMQAMASSMTGRNHADKVFPWNAQRDAWRNGILKLTVMPQHIAALWRAGDLVRADQDEGTAVVNDGGAA